MAGVQSRLVKAGLGKQSAKDSAATEATYNFGVLGGAIVSPEIDEGPLNATSGKRLADGHERISVVPGSQIDTYGLSDSVGLLLLGATGSVTTTGAEAPYTHAFTLADDLPYLTVFADYDGEYYQVQNSLVDSFELSFDGAGATEVSAALVGTTLVFDGSTAYTATNEEDGSDPLRAAGGSFTLGGSTARAVSGSFTISNSVEAILEATSVEPDDVFPGIQVIEFTLTVLPDNLNDFREAVTGSAGGTSPADTPTTKAVSLQVGDVGGDTLTFAASNAAVLVDFPDASPDGGPAEVTVDGIVIAADSGDDYTVTLVNDVETY